MAQLRPMKAIIFTDLDASLLHEETFSCVQIIDTLNALRSDGVLIAPFNDLAAVEMMLSEHDDIAALTYDSALTRISSQAVGVM